MMGGIYKNAEAVYSWLGMQGPEIEAVMKNDYYMIQFGTRHHHMWDAGDLRKARSALRQLFHNQYWERAWIVQEYILAKRSILCFGSTLVTDWDLHDLAEDLLPPSRYWPGEVRAWPKLPISYSLINDRHERMRTNSQLVEGVEPELQAKKLKMLLEHYKKAGCADVHDKIYAFLGLLELDHGIEVDYSKPIVELFFDVMDHLLKNGENFDSYTIALEALDLNKESLEEYMAVYRDGDHQPRFTLETWYLGSIDSISRPSQTGLLFANVNGRCWATVFGLMFQTVPSAQVGDQVWEVQGSLYGYVVRCGSTGGEDPAVHTLKVIGRYGNGGFFEDTLVTELNDGSFIPSISRLPELFIKKDEKRRRDLNGYKPRSPYSASCSVCRDLIMNDIMTFKLTNAQLIQDVLGIIH
jgi:hypothetical protein